MRIAEEKIADIARFVQHHAEHSEVIVCLDILPDIIRFDCYNAQCVDNLQIGYDRTEAFGDME